MIFNGLASQNKSLLSKYLVLIFNSGDTIKNAAVLKNKYIFLWVGMGWNFNINADVIKYSTGKSEVESSVTSENYKKSWRMGKTRED